jgi:hypothetical protein
LHNVRAQVFQVHFVHLLAFRDVFVFVRSLGLFSNVFSLLLVSPGVRGGGGSLVSVFRDAKVIVEALLGDAFAPAVSFNLFNVILKLLAVGKALVALDSVVVGLELLLLGLLNGFALLKSPGLLQFQLLVNPAPCKLVQILF